MLKKACNLCFQKKNLSSEVCSVVGKTSYVIG